MEVILAQRHSGVGLAGCGEYAVVEVIAFKVRFLDEGGSKDLILQPLTEVRVSDLNESLDTVNIALEVNVCNTPLGNYEHNVVLEHGDDRAGGHPGNYVGLGNAFLVNIGGAQAEEAAAVLAALSTPDVCHRAAHSGIGLETLSLGARLTKKVYHEGSVYSNQVLIFHNTESFDAHGSGNESYVVLVAIFREPLKGFSGASAGAGGAESGDLAGLEQRHHAVAENLGEYLEGAGSLIQVGENSLAQTAEADLNLIALVYVGEDERSNLLVYLGGLRSGQLKHFGVVLDDIVELGDVDVAPLDLVSRNGIYAGCINETELLGDLGHSLGKSVGATP